MLILAGLLYILFPIFIFLNLIHLSPEIYHITTLEICLTKYRPIERNIDHKFKDMDHLSKMVDYRPMVDNVDPVAAVSAPSHKLCKIQHSLLCQPSSIEADC